MIRVALIVAFFILSCGQALASPQVLLLHSYHRGNEWTGSIIQGMETVLQQALPEAELFTEYMDSKRHSPEVIVSPFKRYLAAKYRTRRFDVILCSDDNALDFLLSFRGDLFPGTPVIFCGINDFHEDRLAGHTGFTGVAEEADLKGTLELALQLHPKTRRVALVTDTTPSGRADLQRVRNLVPEYANRLEFLELTELSAPRLKQALAALPPHSLVILLDYFRDDQGRYFAVEEGNALICNACAVPVYSLWGFRIKSGVIGGLVTSGRQQGEAAARMALRILNGLNPADIPVLRESPNEYLFDFPALQRFNIPLNALPPDSRILNSPPAIFTLTRRQLLAALLLVSAIAAALLVDIGLRRRVEKVLQSRQARLKAIHDNVAAGIARTDRQGRYVDVNNKWAAMFGCSAQELLGKNFLELTFAEDREENSRRVLDLLEGKTDHYRQQKRFSREDGTVFWVDNSVTPIVNHEGEVEALVGVITDITEHKQTEEQLQAANRELDAFASTVSHDLRSPLTGISGFVQLLEKEYRQRLDDQGAALLGHIQGCTEKMQQLLEDLLAFARVGFVDLPPEAVDAEQVANEVALVQSQKAPGVTITRGPLPAIHIPRSFLLQLFDNLIGNAVRYAGCASGPIEVGGERKDERVRYFVRDHGPGVPPEERERIFDPFFRGTVGKNSKGTGIGLATVQKIARLYGGRAWLEETPGGGCTFWVEMKDRSVKPKKI